MTDRDTYRQSSPFCYVLYAARYPCVFGPEILPDTAFIAPSLAVRTEPKRLLRHTDQSPKVVIAPSGDRKSPCGSVETT